MNSKQISAIVLLTVIFLLPLLIFGGNLAALTGALDSNVPFSESTEEFIREHMPFRTQLQQLAIDLRYRGGQVEQNGIFITQDMLLKNVQPPSADCVEENLEAIRTYSESSRRPTYFMLIPTACAIKQQQLPDPLLETLFNQKSFIETTYSAISGITSVVDVYPQLFATREEYTYFRTHENLTGLGGYYIYNVLGKRLGLSPIKGLDQFDIEYASNQFYGSVYEQSPYKDISPDVLALYRFSRYRREYQVTHYDAAGGRKAYYTLYPQSAATLSGNPYDRLLGGRSPKVEIHVSTGGSDSLLIFCDDTVMSYLPFLLTHYQNITLIDLSTANQELLHSLDPSRYSQVLFAYSVDTFAHSNQLAPLINTQ